MQNDNLDILEALSAVLMALKETGILCTMDIHVNQWPTYALALGKCESTDGKVFNQCQDLKILVTLNPTMKVISKDIVHRLLIESRLGSLGRISNSLEK